MTALLNRLAPPTLRGRLALAALLTATLLITVLTVAFNMVIRQHLQHQADDALHTRAAAVATSVDTNGPHVRVHESDHDELLDSNVWIYDGTRLIEQPPHSTPSNTLTRIARRLAAEGGQLCTTVEGPTPVRLCSQQLTGPAGQATLVTALDLAPYRSSAAISLQGSLVLDALMLACTYTLARLSARFALRPVHTMTDQALRRSAAGSGDRFGAANRPDELARLASSMDTLLDRIRALLRHERQLTAELSHELRTPLSRIVAELDWCQAHPRTPAETRAAHGVLSQAADAMNTICDTLLNDARENAHTVPGSVELLPALHLLAGHLVVPGRVTLTLTARQPNLEAAVASALLARVVSPLLANALRHARTRVSMCARRDGNNVRIDITDDGPGVPAGFVGQLFVPGRRANPADGHDGSGLGLPLARRLARSADGEVRYDEHHTRGARFTVSLPSGCPAQDR